MVRSATSTQVVATGLAFPEGPRWHDGRLWFSDMHARTVFAMATDGHLEPVIEVEHRPSGLGWTPDGDLLVVSMHDRKVLRLSAGGLVEHADLSAHAPWHCNDMVVDRAGRAYVGNFGFDEADPTAFARTAVHLVDPSGRVRVAADGLAFPNGMVITPDDATIVIAQSYSQRLTAFDIETDGTLTGRRPFAKFDDAAPDGICLDAEGAIWVASPPTNEVLRVLDGGRIVARHSTGDNQAFACVLGDEDRRTLYVCTAPTNVPDDAARLRGGRIEQIRVDVAGAGRP